MHDLSVVPGLSVGQDWRCGVVELQDVTRAVAQQRDHRLKDVPALAAVRPKDAGQHRVCLRPFLGPVPRRQLPCAKKPMPGVIEKLPVRGRKWGF